MPISSGETSAPWIAPPKIHAAPSLCDASVHHSLDFEPGAPCSAEYLKFFEPACDCSGTTTLPVRLVAVRVVLVGLGQHDAHVA